VEKERGTKRGVRSVSHFSVRLRILGLGRLTLLNDSLDISRCNNLLGKLAIEMGR